MTWKDYRIKRWGNSCTGARVSNSYREGVSGTGKDSTCEVGTFRTHPFMRERTEH